MVHRRCPLFDFVVIVVIVVAAHCIALEHRAAQLAIRRILQEWIYARPLQRECPAFNAIVTAALCLLCGKRYKALRQVAEIRTLRDEQFEFVGLVEHVLLELLRQGCQLGVDLAQTCLCLRLEICARAHELLVGFLEQPLLFGIQLQLIGDRTLLAVLFDERTNMGLVRFYAQETSQHIEQVLTEIAMLDEWEERDRPPRLERRYSFPDYRTLRDFLDRAAELSEREGLYPDMGFGRDYVNVTIHVDEGSEVLTDKQRQFADSLDALYAEQVES